MDHRERLAKPQARLAKRLADQRKAEAARIRYLRECAESVRRDVDNLRNIGCEVQPALLIAFMDRLLEEAPGNALSQDTWRLAAVVRAYLARTVAAGLATGINNSLPNRAGMDSANAIGTMFFGMGYKLTEENKIDVPQGARPQDSGKTWLLRTRNRYKEGANCADDVEALHDEIIRTLLAFLPSRGAPTPGETASSCS